MCGSVIEDDNNPLYDMMGMNISMTTMNDKMLVANSDELIDCCRACTKSPGVIECSCINLSSSNDSNPPYHKSLCSNSTK